MEKQKYSKQLALTKGVCKVSERFNKKWTKKNVDVKADAKAYDVGTGAIATTLSYWQIVHDPRNSTPHTHG